MKDIQNLENLEKISRNLLLFLQSDDSILRHSLNDPIDKFIFFRAASLSEHTIKINDFEIKFIYECIIQLNNSTNTVQINDISFDIPKELIKFSSLDTNKGILTCFYLNYPCQCEKYVQRIEKNTPIFIGHRGCGQNGKNVSKDYRENTIEAFQKSLNYNVNYVELDVHLTNDRIPIVYHDFKIKNGENEIFPWELNFFDIQQIDNQNNFIDKIPTLKSVLEKLNPDLNINIEIKYPSTLEIDQGLLGSLPSVDEYICTILDVCCKKNNREIFFSSFHLDIAIYMAFSQKIYDVYWLFCRDSQKLHNIDDNLAAKILKRYGLKGMVLDSCMHKELIVNFNNSLIENGYKLLLYGDNLDSDNNIQFFKDIGVYGLIIDDLSLAK